MHIYLRMRRILMHGKEISNVQELFFFFLEFPPPKKKEQFWVFTIVRTFQNLHTHSSLYLLRNHQRCSFPLNSLKSGTEGKYL
jgi:hypothetical protein